MGQWFLLGVFLAIVTVFVPACVFPASQRSDPKLLIAEAVVFGVSLVVIAAANMILAIAGAAVGTRRRHRPHRLFTPLYVQR